MSCVDSNEDSLRVPPKALKDCSVNEAVQSTEQDLVSTSPPSFFRRVEKRARLVKAVEKKIQFAYELAR